MAECLLLVWNYLPLPLLSTFSYLYFLTQTMKIKDISKSFKSVGDDVELTVCSALLCSTILCTEWAMPAAPDRTLHRLKSDTCCSERSMTCCRRRPRRGWALCSLITACGAFFLFLFSLKRTSPLKRFHPIKTQHNRLLSEIIWYGNSRWSVMMKLMM